MADYYGFDYFLYGRDSELTSLLQGLCIVDDPLLFVPSHTAVFVINLYDL